VEVPIPIWLFVVSTRRVVVLFAKVEMPVTARVEEAPMASWTSRVELKVEEAEEIRPERK